MSKLLETKTLIRKATPSTKSKAHLLDNPPKLSFNPTFSGGTGTDMIEKETCSQSTRNIITINLTTTNEQETVMLSKKRKKEDKGNTKQYDYHKAQKQKLLALQNEKFALMNQIALISKNNIEYLFNLIPESLLEFRDIIAPSTISLKDSNGCNEYMEYLKSQIDTLNDIYQFDQDVSNSEIFKEQHSLYEFLLKMSSFANKLKSYYTFIQRIR